MGEEIVPGSRYCPYCGREFRYLRVSQRLSHHKRTCSLNPNKVPKWKHPGSKTYEMLACQVRSTSRRPYRTRLPRALLLQSMREPLGLG